MQERRFPPAVNAVVSRRTRTREDETLLLNQAKQITQLMEQPGWLFIQELIREMHDAQELRLLGSGLSTLEQAEYALAAGQLHGLKAVEGIARAVVQAAAEIDAERAAETDQRQTGAGGQ